MKKGIKTYKNRKEKVLEHFGEVIVDFFSMPDKQYDYLTFVSVDFINGTVVADSYAPEVSVFQGLSNPFRMVS